MHMQCILSLYALRWTMQMAKHSHNKSNEPQRNILEGALEGGHLRLAILSENNCLNETNRRRA